MSNNPNRVFALVAVTSMLLVACSGPGGGAPVNSSSGDRWIVEKDIVIRYETHPNHKHID